MSNAIKLDAKHIDIQTEDNGKISFHMIPDGYLKNVVQAEEPKSIYNRLPDAIIDRVRNGKSIILNEKYITVTNGNIIFCE